MDGLAGGAGVACGGLGECLDPCIDDLAPSVGLVSESDEAFTSICRRDPPQQARQDAHFGHKANLVVTRLRREVDRAEIAAERLPSVGESRSEASHADEGCWMLVTRAGGFDHELHPLEHLFERGA